MRKFFPIVALSLATLLVPAVAQANSTTQTFTHVAQTVPYSFMFAANQFNPASGTLTSIQIMVTTDIVGSVTVANYNTTAQSFTNATAGVPVGLTGPNGLSLAVTATTPGVSGTVAAGSGPPGNLPFPTGTPGTTTVSGLTITSMTSTTFSDAGSLSPYIGVGSNSLNFIFAAGTGQFSGSANPYVFFGGSATADATVVITYNFSPSVIPEPASLAMLGLGLAGVFGFRRIRRRAV